MGVGSSEEGDGCPYAGGLAGMGFVSPENMNGRCVSRDRRAGGHAVHVSQGVGSGVMVFMSPETGCLGHMGFMSLQAG